MLKGPQEERKGAGRGVSRAQKRAKKTGSAPQGRRVHVRLNRTSVPPHCGAVHCFLPPGERRRALRLRSPRHGHDPPTPTACKRSPQHQLHPHRIPSYSCTHLTLLTPSRYFSQAPVLQPQSTPSTLVNASPLTGGDCTTGLETTCIDSKKARFLACSSNSASRARCAFLAARRASSRRTPANMVCAGTKEAVSDGHESEGGRGRGSPPALAAG